MKADELAAIRDDVRTAILEAYANGDPTLLPQLLDKLFAEISGLALDPDQPASVRPFTRVDPAVQYWAVSLLRNVQVRAISRIPYGEPTHDNEPEDHRDQPTA